jgi:TP901 family phage tail tape measure protein
MARAGFKNHEIMTGVGGVLSAAAASGLEMAEVADVVGSSIQGMGLQASDAGRVADVLTVASARTKSTIGSLGESMKNLAPVARQMGVSFEEAVASVALLQHVGQDASEAGTATATMLTKLAAPSAAVAAKMKQLGVAFQDAAGNALPLPDILANFDKAAKSAGGNMEVVAFFSELVGLRGQRAALGLKEMFASGALSSLTEELQDAAGAAKTMADLRMDTLLGDFTLLGSAVDGVKVALFGLEGGGLRKVVQRMTEWVSANKTLIVSKVAKFLQQTKEFALGLADGFVAVREAAAPAFSMLAGIFGVFGAGTGNAREFGATIVKVGGAFLGFVLAVKVARGALLVYTGIVHGLAAAKALLAFASRGAAAALGLAHRAALAGAGASATAAVATGTLTTSMSALAVQLAAVAAAYIAVNAAMDQNERLKKSTEGLGIFDILGESISTGKSPFEVVDEHQNKLAKKRAEAAKLAAKGAGPANAFDPTQLGTLGQFENLDAMTAALAKSQAEQLAKLTEGTGAADDVQARLDALLAGVEGPARARARARGESPEGFDVQTGARRDAGGAAPAQVVASRRDADTQSREVLDVLQKIEANTTPGKSEILVKDDTGRAEVRRLSGPRQRLRVERSGSF